MYIYSFEVLKGTVHLLNLKKIFFFENLSGVRIRFKQKDCRMMRNIDSGDRIYNEGPFPPGSAACSVSLKFEL